jgi:hypothetical protein
LKIDSLVEEFARKEGRSKNEMIIHLITRGIHLTSYDVEKYSLLNFFDLQGQNCKEK